MTLNKDKGATLLDHCAILDFTNFIKSATCFMKNSIPSLVDVILTNQPQFFVSTLRILDAASVIGTASQVWQSGVLQSEWKSRVPNIAVSKTLIKTHSTMMLDGYSFMRPMHSMRSIRLMSGCCLMS